MSGAHAATQKPLDKSKVAWWTIAAPFLGIVTVFILTVLDPLEFESVTKHHSANVFYKIYGAAYPPRVRDSISVVMLDNNTLNNLFRESWPPSHAVHSAVLSAILQYKPAAVLVDMFFFHESRDDHFTNTQVVIDKYSEAGVPVFIVAAGEGIGATRLGRSEIEDLAYHQKVTLVSAELAGEPGQPHLYPMHKDNSQPNREPAALSLYEAICRQDSKPHNLALEQIRASAKCDDISGTDQSQNMEVVWGLAPAEINCERARITSKDFRLACDDVSKTVIGRTSQLLWQVPTPSEHRLTDPYPIPYHAVISTSEVLRGENFDELKKWLGGKVVIYGSQVAPRKDFVLSPIHGNIDGAFIHAMALDNLLTFGNGYVHQASEGVFRLNWTKFLALTVMLVAGLAVIVHRLFLLSDKSQYQTIKALREADEHFLRCWVRFPIILAIPLVGFALFLGWGIAPFNWLGLLVVVHIAHRMDKWFFKTVENEATRAGWK